MALRQTTTNLKQWKYNWETDFYDWLTDRPDPQLRRSWRFRGKGVGRWFAQAHLNPAGSGCQGLYAQVLKCLDGGAGPAYLPANDCAMELDKYFQCMRASKGFKKHWRNDVIGGYKDYLEKFDTMELKRSSWKQTRNLMRFWYGTPGNDSRTGGGSVDEKLGTYPYFERKGHTPEGWDPMIKDDNFRSVMKDVRYPHIGFMRKNDPRVENKLKYYGRLPDHTVHGGIAGGYIAPPI